ncbi:uncharacterized protein LOC135487970 [Lineus longissimus]|uniref:uncharacterized protein LOC135487970 n=1 Tax=Lineus longissimus TaxID=88925 RepID=UPI002B4EE063
MANMVKEKKLWILVKRFDLLPDNCQDETDVSEQLKCIQIQDDYDSDTVQNVLKDAFRLQDSNLVLKLRNHRQSLIPINGRILANSKLCPYILEVVRLHQHITPQPRSDEMTSYHESWRVKLQNYNDRIGKLEAELPQLEKRRSGGIDRATEEFDKKLSFLQKRIDEAEMTGWKGMFRKAPLW